MIIKEFLQWTVNSDTKSRVMAVRALCEAYISGHFTSEEMKAAEGSMALLLEDLSPAVRKEMATVLAQSVNVPTMIINALAQDQIEVSAPILAFSPLLSDNSLVDLIATGGFSQQFIIAKRDYLSASVCAALVEVGDKEAVLALLDNPNAHIARLSISRLAERFGYYGPIRSQLLERCDLPSDTRHKLVEELSNTFANSPLVGALMGKDRLVNVTKDACFHATISLAETTQGDDMLALVEHLRISGKLTPAFLMHVLTIGNVDFFATIIEKLSGKSISRIRAILADGHSSVVNALYVSAGLDGEICPAFVSATLLWRKASSSNHHMTGDQITEYLMEEYYDELHKDSAIAELLMMLEKIQFAQRRKMAKQFALSLTSQVSEVAHVPQALPAPEVTQDPQESEAA
ncbi:MAG: DUF2336 domain-containing protein [Lentilitoribacter sp.]